MHPTTDIEKLQKEIENINWNIIEIIELRGKRRAGRSNTGNFLYHRGTPTENNNRTRI